MAKAKQRFKPRRFYFEGNKVRVILDESGQPAWVLQDISRLLGHKKNFAPRLAKHTALINRPQVIIASKRMTVVNETGLLDILDNAPDSKKAYAIVQWATDTVLPALENGASGCDARKDNNMRKENLPSVQMPAHELQIKKDPRDAFAIFEYMHDRKVRVYMDEKDNPWFVAKDVCDVLCIANSQMAVTRLDNDEKMGVSLTDPTGRVQNTTVINEPGLYTLILGSRKSEARSFKRWVTHDVIPQLRANKTYSLNPTEYEQGYLNYCLKFEGMLEKATSTMQMLSHENRELKLQNQTNEKQLAVQKPKVEACERLELLEPTTTLREYGIMTGAGQKKVVTILLKHKYLYRAPSNNGKAGRLMPYSQYTRAPKDYFRMVNDLDARGCLRKYVKLTTEGIIKLAHLFKREEETVPIDQWLENPPRIPFIRQSV